MLAMIELPWNCDEKFKAAPELYKQMLPRLRECFPDQTFKDDPTERMYVHGTRLVDLNEAAPLLIAFGIDVVVKRFKGAYWIGDRPNGEKHAEAAALGSRITNVSVSISDVGLTAMDEVKVVEDACTDALQVDLDNGWRIIAVCPPEAQRRPDYVMGRTPIMRETKGKGKEL